MKRLAFAALAVLILATPAFALTAGDVIDKMTAKERAGYIAGTIEMAMVMTPERAQCIGDWYFASGTPNEGKAQQAIVAALSKYKDKPAASIINALLKKNCQ